MHGYAGTFCNHYQAAVERMAGLPVFNPALSVSIPAWYRMENGVEAGLVITPWCINFLWLPVSAELPKGATCLLSLPSGDYEGIVAQLDDGTRFGSASLVSDTSALNGQAAATELVREMEKLIFAVPSPEALADQPAMPARRQLFRRLLGSQP